MMATSDVHEIVKQAHVIRGAYLGQLFKSWFKVLHDALTAHKDVPHGHTSAA